MCLEDYEHVVDFQGRCYVVLYRIGGWGLLSAMSAQRQHHWDGDEASVWSIAERLFALAGFELSSKSGEPSGEVSTLKPAFLVHPGQDLRGAVKVVDYGASQRGAAEVKHAGLTDTPERTGQSHPPVSC